MISEDVSRVQHMSGLSTVAVLESTMGIEIGSECTFMRQDFEKIPKHFGRIGECATRRACVVLWCGAVLVCA